MKSNLRHSATTLFSRLLLALALILPAQAGIIGPQFSASFSPNTIGPGSTSTLTFSISNPTNVAITNMAFSNILPAGVTIADPASATTDCPSGIVSAPNGGSTITFSDGSIAANGGICTVSVNVTSSTVGTVTNTSGELTSDGGDSAPATADLTVATNRPGFSMSFAPSTVRLQERSTLTFTIDNSANVSALTSANFSNTLPSGLVVADPANASTDCSGPTVNLTAVPGSNLISLSANGIDFAGFRVVPAGGTCTVTVDVIGVVSGPQENVSGELSTNFGSAGFATDTLEVATPSVVSISKSFLSDPIPPGGTVDVEYTIFNRDRDSAATNIAFTDDLDGALSGLVATGLPQNDVCGAGSEVSGTSQIFFSGGTLAAGTSCRFTVTLSVPSSAAVGGYVSSTSQVTADLDGQSVTGDTASDTLFVQPAPTIAMTFLPSTIGAGGTVTVEYTVTNTDSSASATDINFVQNLADTIPGISAVNLPADGFCGAGSTLTFVSNNPPPPSDVTVTLTMSNGTLGPGESCTFQVDFVIPSNAPAGTIIFETGPVTATVDGATATGASASTPLNIVGGLQIQKSFGENAFLPGGNATLEYTIFLAEGAPAAASNIAFTDDLDSLITGLAATGLPLNNICGDGSSLSGTSIISFTGGSLEPGESCTFTVQLQVPNDAPLGNFTSTTSDLTFQAGGLNLTLPGATDTFDIVSLSLTHSFTDDPVIPGGTATLEYTLTNSSPTADATGIFFTHNLSGILPGLTTTGALPTDPCGTGSTVSGTTFLIMVGGSVSAGTSCTFSVTVQVPAGAANDTYGSLTSGLTATISGSTVTLPVSVDTLTVSNNLLQISKSFTDDPVIPGGTTILEYTVTNSDPSETIANIAFTDDLDTALSGLVAVGLPMNDICGVGSQISGTSLVSFTGGSLAPGASCTFGIMVQVPAVVPFGTMVTSTTSQLTGTASGLPVVGDPASDELQISPVRFTKSFGGSAFAGSPVTLSFLIENLSTTETVSNLGFLDNFDNVISGLVAVGLPANDVCGTGSVLSGTSTLALTGGSLGPEESCTITVPVLVPLGTTPGSYLNTSSELSQGGVTLAGPATATLVVNPPPAFSIQPLSASKAEGNSGGTDFTFRVTRDANVSTVASVNYSVTGSGSAPADAADFGGTLPTGQVVNFASGEAMKDIVVSISGDLMVERDETFTVTLASPSPGTVISQATASGTIMNDDAATLAINDITLDEGDSGTTDFVFTVTPSAPVDAGYSVDFSTSLDTAQAADLTASNGTLNFTGAVGETLTITVPVAGETILEEDETFFVDLADLNANGRNLSILDGRGLGTITNDDAGSVTINDATLMEGDTGTTNFEFIVTSTVAVSGGFSVDFATANGTTTSADFSTTANGMLNFTGTANETQTITVVVSGDEVVEVDENFTVTLSNIANTTLNVVIDDNEGLGTITNDDQARVTLAGSSVQEGDSGATNVTFTATLSAEVDVPVRLDFSTSNGTATVDEDYTAVTVPMGEVTTSGTDFSVPLIPENLAEGDETITGILSNLNAGGRNVVLANNLTSLSAMATIVNDDFAPVGNEDGVYSVPEDGVLTVTRAQGVLINDTDADDGDGPDNLTTTSVVDDVDNGTLSLNADGSFTYTPDQNYFGEDAFTYVVSDGTNMSQGVARIIVQEQIDIAITMATPTPTLIAGGQPHLIFEATVTNQGPSDATGVQLTLASQLPEGVSMTSLVPSQGSVTGGIWSLDLAESATATLRVMLVAASETPSGLNSVSYTVSRTASDQSDQMVDNDSAIATASVVNASDATISSSEPVQNPETGLFITQVTVTNNSPVTFTPFRLFVNGLPEGVTLFNRDGNAPFGNPLVETPYQLSNLRLAPGASTVFTVAYTNVPQDGSFSPQYHVVLLPEPEVAPPVGGIADLPNVEPLSDGSVLVEFGINPSLPSGLSFSIQVSNDLINWMPIAENLIPTSDRLQFIDRDVRLTQRARYYRLLVSF